MKISLYWKITIPSIIVYVALLSLNSRLGFPTSIIMDIPVMLGYFIVLGLAVKWTEIDRRIHKND